MATADRDELMRLMRAGHPCVSVVTAEEDHALAAARDAAGDLRHDLRVWDCVRGLHDGLLKDAVGEAETHQPAAALARIAHGSGVTSAGSAVFAFLDLGEHLTREPDVRRLFRLGVDRCQQTGSTLLLIDAEEPPPIVRGAATTVELSYPGEDELDDIVRDVVRRQHQRQPVTVQLTRDGLRAIVNNLRGLTRRQARQAVAEAICEDRRLSADDLASILRHKKRMLSAGGLLDFVSAPVSLDDVGGLDGFKAWLGRRQNALSPAARDFGIDPPRGVLLLGVQGAGKSLAAKAVATAWQRPLLRLDAGILYDRYIGESERRLRDVLRQAGMMAPCVLWVDEIEKAFASAGGGGGGASNDGGLSRRMFGTLLTWMQEHREPVFLVATANDVSALPPELLRKGRFDELFFVDLPGTDARRKIFEIHLTRRKRDPATFDFDALVDASKGYSGAEIEAAVTSALVDAFNQPDGPAEPQTSHVLTALRTSPPLSVTRREHLDELRRWAQGRCVPAD